MDHLQPRRTTDIEAHAKQGEQVHPFVIVLWLALVGISAWVFLTQQGTLTGEAAAPRLRWCVAAAVMLAVLAVVGAVGGPAMVVIFGQAEPKPCRTKQRS